MKEQNVFLFRFSISRSTIKYKKLKRKHFHVILLYTFSSGLPIFIYSHTNQPTIIKPSFESFLDVEYKTFDVEKSIEHKNHQKKFISALYIAASKDKLNFICSVLHRLCFYIFLASVSCNARYLFSHRLVAKKAKRFLLKETRS